MESYGGIKKLTMISLVFLVVTLVVYNQVAFSLGSRINGSPDDTYAILWQLWWYKYSLLSLLSDPSYSAFVESPYGIAVTHTTVVNHLLALPLTWAFGPVASFNIIILASFVLSGIGMYLLAMLITGSTAAAFFSGLAYAFSPFHSVFSASGGMDGAQIQYLPFTLFFLIRYDVQRKSKDLFWLCLFFLLTVLSFGYYAVLIAFSVAAYLLYTRCEPLLFEGRSGGPWSRGGPTALLWYGTIAYLLMLIAVNTFSEAAYPLKVLSVMIAPVAVYMGVSKAGFTFQMRLFDRLREMTSAKRLTLAAGAIIFFGLVLFFLAPVFSAASRNISESYLVPFYSYLMPAADHPLLGFLVPRMFVPSPDPFVGKMVRVGLVFSVLAVLAVRTILRKAGTGARDLKEEFFVVLFFLGISLSLPPLIKTGGFFMYGPIHFFHSVVPPFVDVRRVVVLVLLAGCVLSAISIAGLLRRISRPVLRKAVYFVLLSILAVEFYPTIDVRDMSRVPSAYAELASRPESFAVVEYPLTSLYDARRYEPFYGQTIHGKMLMNPFGAIGHEPKASNPELSSIIEKGGAANEIFANTENAARALARAGVRYVIVRTDKLGRDAVLPEEGLRSAGRFEESALYEVTAEKSGAYAGFIDFYKGAFFKNYLVEKDGRYALENPFVWAPESNAYGRHWLWISKGAGLKVYTDAREASYDLVFYARAASKDALLVVSGSKEVLAEFLVTASPGRFVVKGLRPRGAPLLLNLSVKNEDALTAARGFSDSGTNDRALISVGFSGLVLRDSISDDGVGAGAKGQGGKGQSPSLMFDGIFAGRAEGI